MSTDEQPTLDAFIDGPTDAERDVEPEWTPNSDDPRRCQGCGSHISTEWARVLGDNSDDAHACPQCASGAEIQGGATHNPDYEHYSSRAGGSWR